MKNLIALISLFFLVNQAQAQEKFCGTDEFEEHLMQVDSQLLFLQQQAHTARIAYYRQFLPNYLFPSTSQSLTGSGTDCVNTRFVLPVVVHVVYNAAVPSTKIDTLQVFNQMEALNKAFNNTNGGAKNVNTGIQFCLARRKPDSTAFNGIVYHNSSLSTHYKNTLQTLQDSFGFPADKYINIYVVTTIVDVPNMVLGYANYPYPIANSADGIVVRYNWFGDAQTYTPTNSPLDNASLGKVLVHEMGHYLGLYHPFRDSCQGNGTTDCAIRGDKCCDVPQAKQPNTACVPYNSCIESPEVFDQLENYMDYTPETCKNTFTKDQASLMSSVLLSSRSSLWQPSNINFLDLACCQRSALFNGDNISCQNQDLTFGAYAITGALGYNWKIYKGTVQTVNTTTTDPILNISLPDTGTYSVALTINFASEVFVNSDIDFTLQIVDCSQPIKSTKGNWYFGNYAGLKFYNNGVIRDIEPFKFYPNNINTSEGSLSLSDTAGNLLFYGGANNKDELILYDNNYNEITTSSFFKLTGHSSATQGAIAMPYPGKSNQYMIVHLYNDANTQTVYPFYSVLNLFGTPKIDSLNKSVPYPSYLGNLQCQEGITALTACGDSTYWVIIPMYVGSTVQTKFAVYLVNKQGINYIDQYSFSTKNGLNSTIKFAPNGRYFSYNRTVYLFNRKTGEITEFTDDNGTKDEYIYGVSFSPNSEYLYRYVAYTDTSKYLYDLIQLNPFASNLDKSKKTIAKSALFRTLQQGPDNKMYLSNYQQDYVSSLATPNQRANSGNETGYTIYGPKLAANGVGGRCESGLPNMIDAAEIDKIELDFNFKRNNCLQYTFVPNKCCAIDYYWDFGDGGSSTNEIQSHSFAQKGTYQVKLIAGLDTVIKQVIVGNNMAQLQLTGNTEICDTTISYEYEVTMLPQYSYTFRSKFTPYVNQEGFNKASINWQNADSLFIDLENIEDGCRDTLKFGIQRLPFEILIDSILPQIQIKCKNQSFDTLKPKNLVIGANYQWYKVAGSQFLPISGATSTTFKPLAAADTQYVLVSTKGCNRTVSNYAKTYYMAPSSNITSVYPSQSNQNGCKWGANGNEIILPGGITKAYSWQYKIEVPDSTLRTWKVINGKTEKDVLDNLPKGYNLDLRRIVNFNICADTSDIIKHYFGYVLKEPKDTSICFNTNFSHVFNLPHSTVNDYEVRVKWIKKEYGNRNTSWSGNVIIDSTYYTNDISFTYNSTMSEKFTVLVERTAFYYSSPPDECHLRTYHFIDFIASKASPQITTQPISITKAVNTSASFNVVTATNESNFYQWFVSSDTQNWTPIHGATQNYLTFSSAQKCQDGMYYRVRISNACGTVFSNAAQLTITGGSSPLSDLWMKDSNKDIGAEPNTIISDVTLDVFRSPDVWNCDSTGTCMKHEDAEYKYLSKNTARVKVRNKGASASTGGKLRIYWTLGSTGEIWDTSWLNLPQNRFYNADSAKYFPMGGEITDAGGMAITPISAGDSIIINQEWSPPNPAWYYKIVGADTVYQNKVTVCLYARIEDCNQYDFGMTYPEEYGLTIWGNTTKNNNIATRNFSSYNKVSNNFIIPTEWVGVGRQPSTLPRTRLKITPDNSNTFDNFDVFVETDDRFWQAWDNGGSLGNDLVMVYPGYYQIIGNEFEMSDIALEPNEIVYARLVFVPKVQLNEIPQELFNFSYAQYEGNAQNPVGGYLIEIDNTLGTLNQQQYKRLIAKEKIEWKVQPNPATQDLFVAFELPVERQIEIAIFDIAGKRMDKLEKRVYKKGIQSVNFNVSGWAKGVYIVQFQYNGFVESKKLVINR